MFLKKTFTISIDLNSNFSVYDPKSVIEYNCMQKTNVAKYLLCSL